MRGVPLTPEQLARAAEVYAQTGNYQAAADAIGSDRSNVRRRLIARGEPHRAALHAQACARATRRARRHLARGVDVAAGLLAAESRDGAGMEPRDVAQVLNALARASDALLAIAERVDRSRQAALTRAKTRAEIAALTRAPGAAGVRPGELDELERALRAAVAEPAPGAGGAAAV